MLALHYVVKGSLLQSSGEYGHVVRAFSDLLQTNGSFLMHARMQINQGVTADAYRWAIIGYGKVAVAHTEGIINEGMRLVGYSTTNPKLRTGNATDLIFNIGPTQGRFLNTEGMIVVSKPDDLLSHVYGKADGVIICSPTDSHLEMVKEVGITGMDCFVEKPMAATVAEAREMIAYFSGKRGKLVVGHVLPAFSAFAVLRSAILRKGADQVKSLTMRRFIPWSDTDNEAKTVACGGWAKDLLIHDVHLLCSVGTPLGVHTVRSESRYEMMQNATLHVELKEAQGAFVVTGGASKDYPGFHHSYEVEFEDGTKLSYDGDMVTGYNGEMEPQSVGQIFGNELALAASYFRGKREDASFLCPTMALNALKCLEAAAISAKESRYVNV